MSTEADPPFRSVAVVGLGLIGGSIALSLRQAWPSAAVIGVDRPEVSAAAHRLGATTESRASVEELQDVELIVLATPVPEIVRLIGAAAAAKLDAIVTDVGSTKRLVTEAAASAALRFVGGHPIAGSAHGGLTHARPDLFAGREWLLVPGGAPEDDVRRLERLVIEGLRAEPRRIDAAAHDRAMAYVSHLPQLVATALMKTAGAAVGPDGLDVAGPGFSDMTRLASSSAEIWRGILASNADFVAEALDAFISALPSTVSALRDPGSIDRLFAEANAWVDRKPVKGEKC